MSILIVQGRTKITKAPMPNTLQEIRDIIGGSMEVVNLGRITMVEALMPYLLVCNEEGKLEGLPPVMRCPYDIICGTFFICKDGFPDSEEFEPLAEKEMETIAMTIQPLLLGGK